MKWVRGLALPVALVLVVGLAFWLRVPDLGDKCFHSDEGVNGWFSLRLYWWNLYRYQPADYHGPFLYYVNVLMFWLLGGPSDFAMRFGTVLTGSLVPLVLLPARRQLGDVGVAVTGLLLVAAPCMTYFSRTSIHEVHLIFFTTLWGAALVRYAAEPSRKWGLIAAAAAFGCFANKETALITSATFVFGVGLAWLVGKRVPDEGGLEEPDLFGGRSRSEAMRDWFKTPWTVWLAGVVLFFVLMVVLFSSFFNNWYGVGSFFTAYAPWFEHGTSGRNQGKAFPYFWEVMRDTQMFATWPAILAMGLAVVRRHRFGLVLTGWAVSAFLVYSLIPYKTPWCVLNIDLPAFVLCGWLAGQSVLLMRDLGAHPALRAIAIVGVLLPVAAVPAMIETTLLDNAERYDDDDVSYVYVQTLRGQFDMVSDHLGVAAASPDDDGRGLRTINLEAKNPVRWYLITRGWDHTRVDYVKDIPEVEDLQKVDIVAVTGIHRTELGRRVTEDEGSAWHLELYGLRPGWTVAVYYRQDLWDAYQEAGGREAWGWPIPESDDIFEPQKDKRYWTRRDKRRYAETGASRK
jgi:uncharacterized protein (TIGR03663 family)